MKILVLLVLFSFQSSGLITKNNGEQIQLKGVEFFQNQDNGSGSSLKYVYRGKSSTIDLGELKRVNLKESLGKKKGVTTWKTLLITKKNEKFEVELDLVEVVGVNNEGKKESYSANAIDKISL